MVEGRANGYHPFAPKAHHLTSVPTPFRWSDLSFPQCLHGHDRLIWSPGGGPGLSRRWQAETVVQRDE